MKTTLFGGKQQALSAADFFRAKLEYEASPYGLKAQMEKSPGEAWVIDVRSTDAYREGHIPGAHSIPIDQLTSKLNSLPRDRVIVTYCGDITCPLSSKAALQLAEKGFRVQHLVGGFAEWSRKGYPVESEPGVGP
jgi:rhodanese-related sulfurtransferase